MEKTYEVNPVDNSIPLIGTLKNPFQLVSIQWEVDGAPGSTECAAYEGPYEIDCLVGAGYKILSVSIV